ncbi:hypothetical protein OG271_30485 [Micromonospora rifamycinica]|uniref:hypothetical protein n=1 Tax=Micromonospora rifamycinica TaxID=291594 RepID=UPI002E27AAC4|nr:hypothetical protein [Micromonospora rifamycinica]
MLNLNRLLEEHAERPRRDAVVIVRPVAGALEALGSPHDRGEFDEHNGRIGAQVHDISDAEMFGRDDSDHAAESYRLRVGIQPVWKILLGCPDRPERLAGRGFVLPAHAR